MLLSHLSLRNVRAYRAADFEFAPSVVVIIGDNAQGKSTLLEAIFLAATGNSPRTRSEKEIIRFGEPFASVRALFRNEGGQESCVEVTMTPDGKRVKLDGSEKRGWQLASPIGVVLFMPEDVQLASGEPRVRREFLDYELSRLSRSYQFNLMHYRRALAHRNAVLKDFASSSSVAASPSNTLMAILDEWDAQLLKYGVKVLAKRQEFLQALEPVVTKIHEKLSESIETFRISYNSTVTAESGVVEEWESTFRKCLLASREKDLKMQATQVGPHRDDLSLQVGGVELRDFGSFGQQRTAVLALKLAVAQIYAQQKGEYPLLLLDDVMSQLDLRRRRQVMEFVSSFKQVFITATDADAIPRLYWDRCAFYRVQGGEVTPLR